MYPVIKNIDLSKFNTFHIKAYAKIFASFSSLAEIDLIREFQNEKLLILGGGSNILLTGNFDGLVLHNQMKGISIIKDDDPYVYVKVGAGESWNDFVEYCIQNGFGGIENLALIPGSVGASPMQNIGAYGVEVKDVIHELTAYHLKDLALHIFNANDCEFGYRDSAFKKKWKNQFIILDVTYRLLKYPTFNISYGAIEKQLETMGVENLSLRSVADAVIAIRKSKLPDPAVIGNAGSFFKNPVVTADLFSRLASEFPSIVGYPDTHTSSVKIAAGWLIEQAGWKGYRKGDAGVHQNQALVLVNYGNASGKEILELSQNIIDSVYSKFGIHLEREVNIV